MKFTEWMEQRLLAEGSKKKGSVPNHMRQKQSNVIKPESVPNQRQRKGISDTAFRGEKGRIKQQAKREAEDY